MPPKTTRKAPYVKRKKSYKSSTWKNPKTRKQKKDKRITKDFVIKKIVDHVKYLDREKRRAPNEDRSLYDNEIDWYNRWKREIENLLKDDPLTFKPIFLHYESETKEYNKEIKRLREENKQLRQEIIVKKARINELEIQIKQVKNEKNREIEELNNQKKIEDLETDFKCSWKLNSQNTTNFNEQYKRLREKTIAYQKILNEKGIMTTPIFERTNSEDLELYFYENENNHT
ncbi:1854_t:CDS:2 [Gigaspora margarita]|uniref:1854_t:CDS:1 n=1 Tax=Gigaspora margarita TaxID=4874 RepID=A0ABN7VHF8_GIGMA|nr:1854_t:CDS:2 [Gigaspora margarita]